MQGILQNDVETLLTVKANSRVFRLIDNAVPVSTISASLARFPANSLGFVLIRCSSAVANFFAEPIEDFCLVILEDPFYICAYEPHLDVFLE